jgi:tRNA (cytidine32/uridine32-2'-O)-methyltransferase
MFENVRIILIRTTHPGNIGSVARAMKNMGFSRLYLVNPRTFPAEEASALAGSAGDILAQAIVTNSLEEAVADCHWVLGLSARERSIAWPSLEARNAATEIVKNLQENDRAQIAFVFGQEQSGLSNEELEKCHFQVIIPASPAYTSLNLAQALQIMTYELRMAFLSHLSHTKEKSENSEKNKQGSDEAEKATHAEMEGFYIQLGSLLRQIQFLGKDSPLLMTRLRRFFNRANPDKIELNILRGILTALQKGV